MTLLSVQEVGKRFDDGRGTRWVLEDVTCAVAAGATAALWGPSGCGKSTLLNLMAGILLPDAGSIRFREPAGGSFLVSAAAERQRVRFRRRRIGFIFQFFNLVPTLTVAENIALPLELNGILNAAGKREQALSRLAALGVAHCGDRFPNTLSGGEQQRVAIARALAHSPALVLADEPTGNLDGDNAGRVVDLLWATVRDADSALVIATHNERIAARADTVIELA